MPDARPPLVGAADAAAALGRAAAPEEPSSSTLGRARLGATPLDDGRCRFRVWAPRAERVELRLLGAGAAGRAAAARATAATSRRSWTGSRRATATATALDGRDELPDPASRWQPDGRARALGGRRPGGVRVDRRRLVRAPPAGRARALRAARRHVHARRARSTAAIERLDDLVELGVTAVELMPVAAVPRARATGATTASTLCAAAVDLRRPRRPAAARRRLPRARARGRARRGLQPLRARGQLPRRFGPYFTDRYQTPWGGAINVDGAGQRRGAPLLLRATRCTGSTSTTSTGCGSTRSTASSTPPPCRSWRELARGRRDARRAPAGALHADRRERPERPAHGRAARQLGGLGLRRAVERRLPPRRCTRCSPASATGYYADFGDARPTWRRRCARASSTRASRPRFRGRRHGAPPAGLDGRRFVVFAQNHDQVGNRALGDRLLAARRSRDA